MDITTPPLPPVAPEVLRVAEHRHKKGLMYPYIFHVLTKVWQPRSVLPALGKECISPFLHFGRKGEKAHRKCSKQDGAESDFLLQFDRVYF